MDELIYIVHMTGLKCDIYYNLHRKCLSVRHKGLVIGHSQNIGMKDVKFIVSEAGRQRVLREKRKNVHATIRGVVWDLNVCDLDPTGIQITYNPYKYDSFVTMDGNPVKGANQVAIYGRKIIAWGLEY